MTIPEKPIDWIVYEDTRVRLGGEFARVLGYLREDGERSVMAIEEAMRAGRAAALVKPACVLKDGAYEFGAEALGEAAETIEVVARHCVETQDSPDQALPVAARLRPLFEKTIAALEAASSPLLQKADRRTR